jgi:hypothetical protein
MCVIQIVFVGQYNELLMWWYHWSCVEKVTVGGVTIVWRAWDHMFAAALWQHLYGMFEWFGIVLSSFIFLLKSILYYANPQRQSHKDPDIFLAPCRPTSFIHMIHSFIHSVRIPFTWVISSVKIQHRSFIWIDSFTRYSSYSDNFKSNLINITCAEVESD